MEGLSSAVGFTATGAVPVSESEPPKAPANSGGSTSLFGAGPVFALHNNAFARHLGICSASGFMASAPVG